MESFKKASEVLEKEWSNFLSGTLQPITLVLEFLRKDGSTVWAESTISGLYDKDKNPLNVLGTTRNITERMQIETEKAKLENQLLQAQKMESIGRLAGGVAHDFNNLLSPILGYSDLLLLNMSQEDPRHDQIIQIRQAALRAKDLTQRLLAFSRKQVLEMKVVDLGHAVKNFEAILKRTLREDITLEIRIGSSECKIKADLAQIQQIIMNLAVNAQDAMPQGGKFVFEIVKMHLDQLQSESHHKIEPGSYVLMTVSDTGHGTTFKIYFPLIEDEDIAAIQAPINEMAGGSETVLVVEDDQAVLMLITGILKMYGYQVIDVGHPDHCLELIKGHEGTIELLLTDVVMPGMNGKELYHKLLPIKPGLKVLYMSGYAEDVIAHHGILEEGVQFLQKPVSVYTLLNKVREIMDKF